MLFRNIIVFDLFYAFSTKICLHKKKTFKIFTVNQCIAIFTNEVKNFTNYFVFLSFITFPLKVEAAFYILLGTGSNIQRVYLAMGLNLLRVDSGEIILYSENR